MKQLILGILILKFVFNSCSPPLASKEQKTVTKIAEHQSDSSQTAVIELNDSAVAPVVSKLPANSLVSVHHFNKAIFVSLKYATTDNFMRKILYDTLTDAYLQPDIAARLAKCQELLTATHPNLHLLVYDAVRPISVQWEMWNALDTIPVHLRTRFLSNPAKGSLHNYGAAVDITICNKDKQPLDMGAHYDDIRPIAYPRLEQRFLASGDLTEQQVANRKLLRKIMQSQGFTNIATEWWHFNACTLETAKKKYVLVRSEK